MNQQLNTYAWNREFVLMRTFESNWEVTGGLGQGYTNWGHQAAPATKFCMVATSIYESSVWNLLHATLLVHRLSRLLLGFRKICAPPELVKLLHNEVLRTWWILWHDVNSWRKMWYFEIPTSNFFHKQGRRMQVRAPMKKYLGPPARPDRLKIFTQSQQASGRRPTT